MVDWSALRATPPLATYDCKLIVLREKSLQVAFADLDAEILAKIARIVGALEEPGVRIG